MEQTRRQEGQADRRRLYNGFGETLAHAFELVATPALFALIGHFLDLWFGTNPVLTIALGIFCLVGMGIRMYYGYVETMKAHEAAVPGARRANSAPQGELVAAGPGKRPPVQRVRATGGGPS